MQGVPLMIVISKKLCLMAPVLIYRRGAILRGVMIGDRAIPLLDIWPFYDFYSKCFKIPDEWYFNKE
jgi:hypothetical protein